MSCPFCEIDNLKTRILKSYENTLVIFSNPRLIPGHILVVPKRHVERLSELETEEKNELLSTLIEWQEKVIDKCATGCDIRQNYRPFLPQSKLKIDHLHFHLLPRELDDELYKKSMIFEKEIFQNTTNEEIDKLIALFTK